MTSKSPVVRAIVAAAIVAVAASSANALTWTCEAITRKDLLDPAGSPFGGKFGKKRHGGPAINSSGDVVFFATPKGGPRRLYLYPKVGAPRTSDLNASSALSLSAFKTSNSRSTRPRRPRRNALEIRTSSNVCDDSRRDPRGSSNTRC